MAAAASVAVVADPVSRTDPLKIGAVVLTAVLAACSGMAADLRSNRVRSIAVRAA